MPNRVWHGTARNSSGDAVASPTVTVNLAGTATLASIFDSAGGAAANPFTGAPDGTFDFYVDDAVKVDVLLAAAGFTSRTLRDLPAAITEHDDQSGLTAGDSHTQYLLLAGRGGQTVADAVAFTSNTTKSNPVFNVMHPDYGATGLNSASDSAAINAAIQDAKAAGGGVVLLPIPPVKFRCDTDIVVDGNNITLRGMGWQSWLNLNGCRIHVDGSAGQLSGFSIEDLQIRRFGTGGVALDLVGAGSNTGPTRFSIRRVNIQGGSGAAGSRDGTCIRLAGVNLGVLDQVFLHDTGTGLLMELDPVSAAFSAPQVMMVGGDVTDCDNGIVGTNLRGFQMLGTTVQFCDTIGIDILGESRGIDLHGVRLETNANFDLRVGNSGAGTTGLTISGCYFTTATSHGVTLIRAKGCAITGNRFFGYTSEAVDIQEASAGDVTGYSDGNTAPAGVVATNGARGWGRASGVLVGRGNPAAGVTQFGSSIAVESSGENSCAVPAPFNGFARNLAIEKTNAPGAGESLTATFRVQNADTALTAALSGASAVTAQDVVNVGTFTRGQRLAIEFTASNNGGYTATQTRASVELVKLED